MSDASRVIRSGFVAVAGRANAGKSTLVNQMVGEHVAIVSPIAQTTRRTVRAVLTAGEDQFIFVDLPGSQRPVDKMTSRMQASVRHALTDVDVILWVVDVSVPAKAGERAVADMILGQGLPVVIAANKLDVDGPAATLERIAALAELIGDRPYNAMVPVSALTGDGVDLVLGELGPLLPQGPAYYGDDDTTDMRSSERIAEYVREAFLGLLRDELPHATTVEVEDLEEDANGVLHATCTLWTETESQVGIAVGKKGATIQQAGTAARAVIEEALGIRVHLDLRVKARKGWRNDEQLLERWGL